MGRDGETSDHVVWVRRGFGQGLDYGLCVRVFGFGIGSGVVLGDARMEFHERLG